MSPEKEKLTKAAQCADLLLSDLRSAYVGSSGAPEMLLLDMISEVTGIRHKLERIAAAAK